MSKYIAILAVIAGVWVHGNYHGKNTERLVWQDTVRVATEQARETEKQRQDKINEALQAQYDGISIINNNLVGDINKLRSRPTRRGVPRDTQTTCTGATGRELSRPDAEFLTRGATRADRLREALKACYAAFDSF